MKFAFLLHPLTARYVDRARIWSRFLPSLFLEGIIKHISPRKIAEFSFKGHTGYFIAIPLTAKQMKTMPKSFVVKRIKQGCDLACSLGAEIVGLGAFTAIATNQGKDLAGNVSVALTTGRAYTVYVVMEQAKQFLKPGQKIAIVGGDGAIGKACATIAQQYGKKYRLVKITKKNLSDVYTADIIISATSSLNTIIDPEKLKKSCVVIDAAKPSNISRKTTRKDITIVDGGVVTVPGNIDFELDFDLGKNELYACMAEPMILAMAGKREDWIGTDISLQKIREIGKLGEKMGFRVKKSRGML